MSYRTTTSCAWPIRSHGARWATEAQCRTRRPATAQLGLTLADDIDALAIGSVPIAPPPLQLGPNVVVWVSLVNGSPSRVPVGLAFIDGVMQVFPGPHAVALDATAFDLAPGDDLDA